MYREPEKSRIPLNERSVSLSQSLNSCFSIPAIPDLLSLSIDDEAMASLSKRPLQKKYC
jgi:hypothetical protein